MPWRDLTVNHWVMLVSENADEEYQDSVSGH